MSVPPVDPLFWQRLADDPILFYSACAALILALVSLGTGLARGDVLVLFRPRGALSVLAAVALGFALVVASERLAAAGAPASAAASAAGWNAGWAAEVVAAAAPLPLLVVTLAFGPSVGLVSGVLFAAATARGAFPGVAEALFALELTVLGWLAIYPSPRAARWAGPLDAAFAHALTWSTAGVAWLTFRDGGVTVAALAEASGTRPLSLIVVTACLLLVGPRWYDAAFPRSRIALDAPALAWRQVEEAPPDPFATAEWRPHARRRPELVPPRLSHDDPNG